MIESMRFFILFLALLFLSCTHLQSRKLASNNSGLNDQDIASIRELFRIRNVVGNDVWPGFGNADFRFVLVGKDNQWAINVDPLPSYYQQIELPGALFDVVSNLGVTEAYRNNIGEKSPEAPTNLFSAWSSAQTEFHFRHPIFFVKALQEYHRAGDNMSAEDWLHISIHELFHTFQDRYVDFTPQFVHATSITYKQTIRYDPEHQNLLVPELKALSRAACGTDVQQVRNDLNEALKLRKKRWKFIRRKYSVNPDDWERYDSWAEGTARYVEYQFMSKWAKYADQTEFKNDPDFKNFEDYKRQSLAGWCYQIADVKGSYWYTIGLADALILDKLDPDWKSRSPDKNLFFDAYFRSLGIREAK